MLSKYQAQIEKLLANNPSFKTLYEEYEATESESKKRELENRLKVILEKVK